MPFKKILSFLMRKDTDEIPIRTPMCKMKTGDVLLMGPFRKFKSHWTDAAIQEITSSKYSHAAIYYHRKNVPDKLLGSSKAIHWILESNSSGVHFTPLVGSKYDKDYVWQAFRLKLKYRKALPKIVEESLGFLGDSYNFFSSYLLGLFLYIPRKLKKLKDWLLKSPNILAKENAHFCSELVVDCYLLGDIHIDEDLGLNKDNITAKDLQYCSYLSRVSYKVKG